MPHPYHPIIYVRGFAATSGEIEDAVADPYMGFNLGSTKTRTAWTGDLKRFYFESPVIRLMCDYEYQDVIEAGDDIVTTDKPNNAVPYRCIVIHRYYEDASEAFSDGNSRPIEHFARRLGQLILRLRQRICENPKNEVTPEDFRVYLVAHSMGGLVCRAFMQNPELGDASARAAVDKLFTYATPHNGIDLRIVNNVPGWRALGDVTNFNRKRMAGYLGLPEGTDDVSEIKGFPAERVFNLVGTNPKDYPVLGGVSAWAAGDASDGLVRIEKATTFGHASDGRRVTSPRAHINRSHSGHYGIVNSEEGYQNLTRFLFGQIRFDGRLDIDDITLPAAVEKQFKAGKTVRASYQFEVVASVRGCHWDIHRRTRREHSAIFRTYDQLFAPSPSSDKRPPDRDQSPHLFSIFLDRKFSHSSRKSVSFAFELSVVVPDYEVDGFLFLDRHYEGATIYRETILLEAFPDSRTRSGWRVCYGFQSKTPNLARRKARGDVFTDSAGSGVVFSLPISQSQRPGLSGALRISARPWNTEPR
ncbi:MAG: hypothetical protein R3F07_11665 [Opitutaceae bacterium]